MPSCKLLLTSIPLKKILRTCMTRRQVFFTPVPFWTEWAVTVANGVGKRQFCPYVEEVLDSWVFNLYTLMKFVVDLHNLTWRGWWTERESKGDFSTPSISMAFRTVLLDHFETNKLVLNIIYLKMEGIFIYWYLPVLSHKTAQAYMRVFCDFK